MGRIWRLDRPRGRTDLQVREEEENIIEVGIWVTILCPTKETNLGEMGKMVCWIRCAFWWKSVDSAWTRETLVASSMLLLLSCQVVSDSLATPWTIVCQAPLSMEFPRQKYWSGEPFPSPGDLLDPEIKPKTPALTGGFFTTESPGKPWHPLHRNEKTWQQ